MKLNTKNLLKAIDLTIDALKGDTTMTNEQLYYGFDAKKQDEYERYILKSYGPKAEKNLETSKRRTASWITKDYPDVKDKGHKILPL